MQVFIIMIYHKEREYKQTMPKKFTRLECISYLSSSCDKEENIVSDLLALANHFGAELEFTHKFLTILSAKKGYSKYSLAQLISMDPETISCDEMCIKHELGNMCYACKDSSQYRNSSIEHEKAIIAYCLNNQGNLNIFMQMAAEFHPEDIFRGYYRIGTKSSKLYLPLNLLVFLLLKENETIPNSEILTSNLLEHIEESSNKEHSLYIDRYINNLYSIEMDLDKMTEYFSIIKKEIEPIRSASPVKSKLPAAPLLPTPLLPTSEKICDQEQEEESNFNSDYQYSDSDILDEQPYYDAPTLELSDINEEEEEYPFGKSDEDYIPSLPVPDASISSDELDNIVDHDWISSTENDLYGETNTNNTAYMQYNSDGYLPFRLQDSALPAITDATLADIEYSLLRSQILCIEYTETPTKKGILIYADTNFYFIDLSEPTFLQALSFYFQPNGKKILLSHNKETVSYYLYSYGLHAEVWSIRTMYECAHPDITDYSPLTIYQKVVTGISEQETWIRFIPYHINLFKKYKALLKEERRKSFDHCHILGQALSYSFKIDDICRNKAIYLRRYINSHELLYSSSLVPLNALEHITLSISYVGQTKCQYSYEHICTFLYNRYLIPKYKIRILQLTDQEVTFVFPKEYYRSLFGTLSRLAIKYGKQYVCDVPHLNLITKDF